LGAGGTLAGDWPLTAALDDAEFAARIERDGGRLFVADSAADVAILHSLGLPVAPAHGVESFSGERIEEFCGKLRIRSPARDDAMGRKSRRRSKSARATDSPLPLSLVVGNWRPSQLSRDDVPAALAAGEHLLGLAEHFGVSCDDHAIWKPTERQVERVQFALANGSEEHIRQAVLDSLDDSCVVLERALRCGHQPPGTNAGALATRAATAGSGELTINTTTIGGLQRIAFTELVVRLLQQGSEAEDSPKQLLHYVLASLSESFHSASCCSVPDTLPIGVGNRAARPFGAVSSDTLRQKLAIANQIIAVTKELRAWR
jgi:hypothetical protein